MHAGQGAAARWDCGQLERAQRQEGPPAPTERPRCRSRAHPPTRPALPPCSLDPPQVIFKIVTIRSALVGFGNSGLMTVVVLFMVSAHGAREDAAAPLPPPPARHRRRRAAAAGSPPAPPGCRRQLELATGAAGLPLRAPDASDAAVRRWRKASPPRAAPTGL